MTDRTRTYRWDDPATTTTAVAQLSGIDLLRRITAGDLPNAPIAASLGMDVVEVEEGRVVFEADPEEFLFNPAGTVHGGFAATILDSAMACAVHSTLPAGSGYTTVDLSVKLVRTLTPPPAGCAAKAASSTSAAVSARRRAASSAPTASSTPTARPPA